MLLLDCYPKIYLGDLITMSEKTEASYTLGGNNAFLDYLRRYRSADICGKFFWGKVQDNSDILDCGCGPGSVTLGLAEWASSGRTIGIDLNSEQFERAGPLRRRKAFLILNFVKQVFSSCPSRRINLILFSRKLYSFIFPTTVRQ